MIGKRNIAHPFSPSTSRGNSSTDPVHCAPSVLSKPPAISLKINEDPRSLRSFDCTKLFNINGLRQDEAGGIPPTHAAHHRPRRVTLYCERFAPKPLCILQKTKLAWRTLRSFERRNSIRIISLTGHPGRGVPPYSSGPVRRTWPASPTPPQTSCRLSTVSCQLSPGFSRPAPAERTTDKTKEPS